MSAEDLFVVMGRWEEPDPPHQVNGKVGHYSAIRLDELLPCAADHTGIATEMLIKVNAKSSHCTNPIYRILCVVCSACT